MSDEIQTYPTQPAEERLNGLVRFFTAPVEVRSYTNLFYLLLSFPLGVFYFTFLVTGLATGFALTLIWIGLPLLALVFAASFGMAALERRLAIHLLGAKVPPMSPPPVAEPQSIWQTIQQFLSNPVTWKGMGYLFLKFPLGILSFVVTVTLLSVSAALILAPAAYTWGEINFVIWDVDTYFETFLVSGMGVLFLFLSINLLNGLALVWREFAEVMLGSRQFEVPSAPAAPPATPPAPPTLPTMALPIS